MKPKPIYVEIPIYAKLDDLWEASQNPQLHEQWDLRFSSITYLPKKENEVQQFTYTRTVGPFYKVEGWGKSVGSYQNDKQRTSSLHFGTDQKLSPIREGRGYWKYEQLDDSVKFLTQYDYDVNFGRSGKIADKFVFRPLIGWATALSFDVLKRWLEKGETPAAQYIRFFSTYIISLAFVFIWMYQGLIPKIIGMHPAELAMVGNVFSDSQVTLTVMIIGVLEVLFGLLWLVYRRKNHLFLLQLILFPLLTIAAVVAVPETAIHPFNPVTFNFSLIILSLIGFMLSKDVPSARSCLRKRRGV
ncbi:DoxX-like family protein [Sporosarcina sp. Marseille-Q4063]|uniref:DoxX-like family protein n=1 Tax=Sporosarcina sp. Marseille-Q4063 TaxID=2810514 RepID=UPI001BAEDC63|nr:DoxX-like family protein [Sporosarcina sp. Marseille-Q4063]QUW23141.1 DoxX-like family protein [Sporosarcina sp. Marseille-Q4063]